jgi:glucose/arabinose dehydrogenase
MAEFMAKKLLILVVLGVLAAASLYLLKVNFWQNSDAKVLQPGERKIISQTAETTAAGPIPETTVASDSQEVEFSLETVASGLFVPWSLIFTDTDRILVSQRDGGIRQIIGGELQDEALYIFDDVSSVGEAGLMGLEIDPEYSQNSYIYACYASSDSNGMKLNVVRLRDNVSALNFDQVVIENIPAARNHAGCRIKFGPDGKLYITTGDAQDKNLPQDLDSLAGKILRLNRDGSVPSDNPFAGSPVYSYGHRNPQGLAWNNETGQLYETEHGPSVFDGPAGGDEVNLIVAGGNYGWPLVSHDGILEGATSPLLTFTPAEAPGSAMFYSGSAFPQYTNKLFFGALRGSGIVVVEFARNNPEKVISYEKLDVDVGRVRDVVEGPDGYIYFTTSNRDGRGNVRDGDDKIYRLVPRN